MEMDRQNPSSSKADRKTVERNRRIQMKALCSRLTSLVPRPAPREDISIQDQLAGATDYIKNLQANLEKMKQKRSCLMGGRVTAKSCARSSSSTTGGLHLPRIDVRVMGSAVQVVLSTGLNCQFLFTETIRVLHEEGAEVVSASFSVLDNTTLHTIHSMIGDQTALDFVAARISERLRKFVQDAN